MKLIIANKNYSSWSMRPWLAARWAGLAFSEETIPLRQLDTAARIRAVSPNGKVPALVDGDLVVCESIAILEYLAGKAPQLWPSDGQARAVARSVSAEMHAGFVPLRARCPMNMRRTPSPIALADDVRANVERIETLWRECRARYGGEGPFLFGAFSNADAMYAPVVSRFHSYAIDVAPASRAYMAAIMALPAWQEWERAALAETALIEDIDRVA